MNETTTLSKALKRTVRKALEVRASALADLDGHDWSNPTLAEWRADRTGDIEYANRTIEGFARLRGLEPAALIAACR